MLQPLKMAEAEQFQASAQRKAWESVTAEMLVSAKGLKPSEIWHRIRQSNHLRQLSLAVASILCLWFPAGMTMYELVVRASGENI